MIRDMKIEMVDHPRPDIVERYSTRSPKQYPALTWKSNHCWSAVAMEFAEETLTQYHIGKDLTTLEYLEALSMIKEYKKDHLSNR